MIVYEAQVIEPPCYGEGIEFRFSGLFTTEEKAQEAIDQYLASPEVIREEEQDWLLSSVHPREVK